MLSGRGKKRAEALARELIHDRQDLHASTVLRSVADEVVAPDMVRVLGPMPRKSQLRAAGSSVLARATSHLNT